MPKRHGARSTFHYSPEMSKVLLAGKPLIYEFEFPPDDNTVYQAAALSLRLVGRPLDHQFMGFDHIRVQLSSGPWESDWFPGVGFACEPMFKFVKAVHVMEDKFTVNVVVDDLLGHTGGTLQAVLWCVCTKDTVVVN